jgi:serine/threonine protein kinase/Tfp pilus assembly protein PilF
MAGTPPHSTQDLTPLVSADVVAEPLSDLTSRLGREMADRWRHGDRVPAEEILAGHTELLRQPEAAVRIIYEEICLREEFGEKTAVVEVAQRFPQYREQLEVVMDCHQLLKPERAEPSFPLSGEDWGDFHLKDELGSGAQGRVFLATQRSLADRFVVLKFTPRVGGEHLSLARLQHTHIVPLYFVEDDKCRNLRALAMPYFGGTTLDRLFLVLSAEPVTRRTGRRLLEVLDYVSSLYPAPNQPGRGPLRELLSRSTYVEAICWIGVWLAEGLQYAHDRGLVHLDVKPSNVLLAADGQPMLLDFHLAQKPLEAHGPAPTWLGGTAGYMAPEQAEAFEALRRRRPVAIAVDKRADIYALGVLLYEALAGVLPFHQQSSGNKAGGRQTCPRLERSNSHVSLGLADIVHKCLAEKPADRYESAEAVAADLKRHLTHLPLKGVRNRSWKEWWQKWRRRRPEAIPWVRLTAAVLLAATALLLFVSNRYRQRLSEARAALEQGREHMQVKAYAPAVQVLERGVGLMEGMYVARGLARELEAERRLASRALAAHELHETAQKLRFLIGLERFSADECRVLEPKARALWLQRDQLLDSESVGRISNPSYEGDADPARVRQIDTDLLDLALLWPDLHVQLALPSEEADARRFALQVLDEASAHFGPCRALDRERDRHAEALGLTTRSATREEAGATRSARHAKPEFQPAWEHYALGRALLQAQDFKKAETEFAKAVSLEPGAFWPNYYHGVCAYRQGRLEDARMSFSICIALEFRSAWCYYNRALAHAAMKPVAVEAAIADYTRALQIDETLAIAWRNRGVLHYQQHNYHEALSDLKKALSHGFEPATTYYDLAAVHLALKDRSEAVKHLHKALQSNPEHQEARTLLDKIQSSR